MHLDHRADEERAVGARRRAARPRQRGRRSAARRDRQARGQGDRALDAQGLDVHDPVRRRRWATAHPPSAIRRPCAATSARATSARNPRAVTTPTPSTRDRRRPRASGTAATRPRRARGRDRARRGARQHRKAPFHGHVHGLPPTAVDDGVDAPPGAAGARWGRGGRDRGLACLSRGRGTAGCRLSARISAAMTSPDTGGWRLPSRRGGAASPNARARAASRAAACEGRSRRGSRPFSPTSAGARRSPCTCSRAR